MSDNFEALLDHWGEWKDRKNRSMVGRPGGDNEGVLSESCPLCSSRLPNFKLLQQHIFESHRDVAAYLRVNGRVVCDADASVAERIRELGVYVSGMDAPWVTLAIETAPGRPISHKEIRNSAEFRRLHEYLPADDFSAVTVSLPSGPRFHIRIQQRQPIRFSEIERTLAPLEKELDMNSTRIDWGKWRSVLQDKCENSAELRYAQALYDYYYGYWLEGLDPGSHDAMKHYERAFDPLYSQSYPQVSPKGKAMSYAIALRLNWFSCLATRPSSSLMSLTGHFLTSPYTEVMRYRKAAWGCLGQPDTRGMELLVADTDFELMKAIGCFYKQDDREVAQILRRLKLMVRQSINDREKVTFLEACWKRALGYNQEARALYEELRDHPHFGKEATAFVES